MDNTTNRTLVPAPALPSSLLPMYDSLDIISKKLFNKVFIYLWGVLVPRSARYNVLHQYYLIDQLRVKYHLTVAHLSVLTYLYQISNKGQLVIDSRKLMRSGSLNMKSFTLYRHIFALKESGYLTRHSRDVSSPYLQRSISRQKIFIQLSGKGVDVIDRIESDLYRLSYNTLIDDITT